MSKVIVSRKCTACGGAFYPTADAVKRGDGRYCSRACFNSWRSRPEERFHRRVNLCGPVILAELGACQLWTGIKDKDGYGLFAIGGTMRRAHRVAFFLAHGRWPRPCACHRCDVRACVNVRHLFEGTAADNNRDRDDKGRRAVLRGSKRSDAKLCEAAVVAIRARSALGATLRELAVDYDVDKATVSCVVKRRTWRHVR